MGQTEEAVREDAQKGGWADKVAVTKTSFKANSKVWLQDCHAGIMTVSVSGNPSLCEREHSAYSVFTLRNQILIGVHVSSKVNYRSYC